MFIIKEKMAKSKILNTLALIVLIVGSANLIAIGFLDVNYFEKFLGVGTLAVNIAYSLVAISIIIRIINLFKRDDMYLNQ